MYAAERKRLSLVHLWRTIGVLLILLGHVNKVFEINYDYEWFNTGQWQRTGGLDFFFIVTGFMMYYLYHKNIGVKGKAKEFLLKRVVKIYPVYWVFTLATLALVLVFPQLGNGREKDIFVIIKNILLFPTVQIIDVTWSLSHVVFFYLLFTLVIYKPKITKPIILVWIIVSIIFEIINPNHKVFLLSFSNMEIISGSLIAYVVMNYKLKFSRLMVFLGIVGYFVIWVNNINNFFNINEVYFYFVSAALIMLGITSLDMEKETKLPKTISNLGDASYSIFISQLPILHFFVLVFGQLNLINTMGYPISMLIIIVLTILSGCLVYYIVEKPIGNFCKTRLFNFSNSSKVHLLPVNKTSKNIN